MAAVIIKKKDVKRLAKELLNEMFKFLHDEYILTEFEEMKEVQKEFLENLAFNHINTLHRPYKITEEKREVLVKPILDKILIIGENSSYFEKNIKVEYLSKLVENVMKDGGIDTEEIYQTLINLKLDMEIDGDLYYNLFTSYFIFKHSYYFFVYTCWYTRFMIRRIIRCVKLFKNIIRYILIKIIRMNLV